MKSIIKFILLISSVFLDILGIYVAFQTSFMLGVFAFIIPPLGIIIGIGHIV